MAHWHPYYDQEYWRKQEDLIDAFDLTITRLDAIVYPHIFHQILQYCTNDTLTKIIRCSTQCFAQASRLLYRHLDLSNTQFRNIRYVDGVYYGDLTSWAAACRRQTVSLSITVEHREPFTGCIVLDMPNLQRLRISHDTSRVIPLSSAVDWRNIHCDHVVIRTIRASWSTPCFRSEFAEDEDPPTPRHITLLTKETYRSQEGLHESLVGSFAGTVTIVYLPFDLSNDRTVYQWSRRYGRIMGEILKWTKVAAVEAKLEVVGLEYGQGQAKGTVTEAKLRADYEVERKDGHYATVGERASVTFRTFESWLDDQEPGVMFDEKDERDFRQKAADLRKRWGDVEWQEAEEESEEEVEPDGYYNDFGCWQANW